MYDAFFCVQRDSIHEFKCISWEKSELVESIFASIDVSITGKGDF